MKVLIADSQFWKGLGEDFQKQYVKKVKSAYKKAAKLLPFGSEYLTFIVQPRKYRLNDMTHDYGHTHNSGLIELSFYPKYAHKHPDKILDRIESLVLHEMNHAARFNIPIWHKTFLDYCVLEGLATVFEREYTDFNPPWGQYPKEVSAWVEEVRKQGRRINYDKYMFKHPDGRFWINYKVGTYLIDQAIKNSGKSVIELTKLECPEILRLSKVL